MSLQKHISQVKRILDVWKTELNQTKLESSAKSPIINNTRKRVSEALKNTFHPLRNQAPLLAVLFPPAHIGKFLFAIFMLLEWKLWNACSRYGTAANILSLMDQIGHFFVLSASTFLLTAILALTGFHVHD
jgi:hypothetical protein